MNRVVYKYVKVKSVISKSNLPDLDYAFNPYIGCTHGCLYCYARDYVSGKYRDVSRNWGTIVYVKENCVEVLKNELRRLRLGVIGVSTITDPYQHIEARLGLVRESIEVMLRYGFNVSIQTKSNLVLRDLDIIRKFKDRVDVGVTLTWLNNDSIMKYIEPNSVRPKERVKVLERLSNEGVETWIFYGPVIPLVNDGEELVKEIVSVAKDTNSKVLIDKLRVRKWMYEIFRQVMNQRKVMSILSKAQDRKWWRNFLNKVLKICKENNVECIPTLAEQQKGISYGLMRYVRESEQK